jgi:hypothetical protein
LARETEREILTCDFWAVYGSCFKIASRGPAEDEEEKKASSRFTGRREHYQKRRIDQVLLMIELNKAKHPHHNYPHI